MSGALKPSLGRSFGGSSERWFAAGRGDDSALLAPFLEGAGGAGGLGAAGSQLGGVAAPSHPLMPWSQSKNSDQVCIVPVWCA